MTFAFKLSRRLAQNFWMAGAAAALTGCVRDLPIHPGSRPVQSITLAPTSATVAVNATVQLYATPRDSQGVALGGRVVTWSSDDEGVATVSGSGVVRGEAAGSTTIRAWSEGKNSGAAVTVTPGGVGFGFYVAPNGASSGDGSEGRPWDLATGLAGGAGRVQPGDTVWLRGGTYRGTFRSAVPGEPGRPVVFRQYPGERATIDGTLRFDGHDVVAWGFEIMRSASAGEEMPNIEARGARQKFINLIVHESAHQGVRFWDEAVDSEIYGNIVYNNGTHENLDHGTYVHNVSGTKLIMDNVFFNNLAYGIHVYATTNNSTQRNVHVVGNVAFNNGTISTRYEAKGNILIGGDVPGRGHRAVDNLLYFSGSAGTNMRLGYNAANEDLLATGNVIWGGATALRVDDWNSASVQGNTIGGTAVVADLHDTPLGHTWSENHYYRSPAADAWRTVTGLALPLDEWKLVTGLGATDDVLDPVPTTTQVFVRPNRYEAGRAHVVVYNWGEQASVAVNLAGVLALGQRYEVRNVQDIFGAPVVSGTYGGGMVMLPMTGVAPPPRIGRSTPAPPRTGPMFDTFVVMPLD